MLFEAATSPKPPALMVPLLMMPASVVVGALPAMLQFLIVLLLAPAPDALASQTTPEDVLKLSFVIVRSREEVPAFEPSIMIKLAPLILMMEVIEDPVMAAVTPVAGLMVTVLIALEPRLALITIGKLSPTFWGAVVLLASNRLKTTGPATNLLFKSATAAVSVG